jgi:hypothetical protein
MNFNLREFLAKLRNLRALAKECLPWFQRFIFIIFIAKGRGKINLWNQGKECSMSIRYIILADGNEAKWRVKFSRWR